MRNRKEHYHYDSAPMDELFLFPLYDFSLGKQFVLSICTDGMQLIPTHQIVDVLTGTIKNATRLGCADNAVLHVMMQCVYR